jgi:mercuric ion binding protein
MKSIRVVAPILLFALSASAWAAPNNVKLDVPGMTCPTCPITIKKALLKQSGVTSVSVNYDKKQLDVAYDDAKTSEQEIVKATAAVGFPSQTIK